jgi:protoheme IX farnesyltransferase
VWWTRIADYLELSKPRIASLVLVVVAVSAFVASGGLPEPWMLGNTLIGTAFIAASASALNQLLERRTDALMDRTADRPLPAGRLHVRQTLTFGIVTLVLGVGYLAWLVNPLTALLGLATWVLYVVCYTPLKSRTSANTAVGAVAGALPVLIGWAGANASFSLEGGPLPGGIRVAALFLILYLWQFPHFMAIAWIYRRQYGDAGLQMLTVVEPSGHRAGLQSLLAALALPPISVLPALYLPGAITYSIGALTLGIVYLGASTWFCWRRDERTARTLLHTSLIYLPALLILLTMSVVSGQ